MDSSSHHRSGFIRAATARYLPVALAAAVACGGNAPARATTVEVRHDGRVLMLRVELADTPTTRARGLMHRAQVPEGTGMLFVWDDVATRTFHMQNTLVALDLLVVRGSRVVQVLHMEPCTSDPCPLYETLLADQAIEAAAGAAAGAGVGVGATVVVRFAR